MKKLILLLLFIPLVFSCSMIKVGNTNHSKEEVETGYGTQQKKNITTAISTISGEELTKSPTHNTSEALSGQVPGLRVRESNVLGDYSSIFIRNFGDPPLIIVDGIETHLDDIDQNDIESISILKDAASAIYGSRAGNGVVIIKTKRGVKNFK